MRLCLCFLLVRTASLTPVLTCDRAWDMRPYAPANRCTKVFAGHVHTFEKNLLRCDWSPDGSKVRQQPWRWVRWAGIPAPVQGILISGYSVQPPLPGLAPAAPLLAAGDGWQW
jgi:hypothetical protein